MAEMIAIFFWGVENAAFVIPWAKVIVGIGLAAGLEGGRRIYRWFRPREGVEPPGVMSRVRAFLSGGSGGGGGDDPDPVSFLR